jgi:hypothetical protein
MGKLSNWLARPNLRILIVFYLNRPLITSITRVQGEVVFDVATAAHPTLENREIDAPNFKRV